MKYKFIWLGQTVLKFEVPLDIFMAIKRMNLIFKPYIKQINN